MHRQGREQGIKGDQSDGDGLTVATGFALVLRTATSPPVILTPAFNKTCKRIGTLRDIHSRDEGLTHNP